MSSLPPFDPTEFNLRKKISSAKMESLFLLIKEIDEFISKDLNIFCVGNIVPIAFAFESKINSSTRKHFPNFVRVLHDMNTDYYENLAKWLRDQLKNRYDSINVVVDPEQYNGVFHLCFRNKGETNVTVTRGWLE